MLNSRQMREADRRTIEDLGVPSAVLMENAGRQVVAAMERACPRLASTRVAVLCGRGNNGGDGFVVARTLLERNVEVDVYLLGHSADVKGDARTNLEVLRRLGQDVVEIGSASAWELHAAAVLGADLLVDALFGTGMTPPLTGMVETIIADVNASGRPIVAVDLPSGLSADSHEIVGPSIHASITVALGAPKLPLVLAPAAALAGKLMVVEIGVPQGIIAGVDGPWVEVLTRESMSALVAPRRPESHKGTYGRVLILAGSRGRTGAAHLAAAAALRSGAGLVTVGTPASCMPIVAALGAEYMVEPLDETSDGTIAWEALDRVFEIPADVIAVGPGLGRSPSTAAFVQGLLERSRVPIVIDADGLNAFGGETDRLAGRDGVDVIMTPHPGEMARLTGLTVEHIQAHRLDVARDFAVAHHVHVVLKGHRTVVATPDGKAFINSTGNPGMATAGTGDVLTGMVAAWFGQLLDAESAATLAVHLHGLAGDLAAAEEGETALTAGDIVARLGEAVLELTGRRQQASSS